MVEVGLNIAVKNEGGGGAVGFSLPKKVEGVWTDEEHLDEIELRSMLNLLYCRLIT